MSPAPLPPVALPTPEGPVPVWHRLALAVDPRDGITGAPATGVRIGRLTPRSGDVAETVPPGPRGRAVLTYDRSLCRAGDAHATVTVRLLLDDPAGRWVPRRLDVAVRGPGAVADPGPGPFVPGWARRVRPWVLPGPGTVVPRGATALRFGVRRPSGEPVPWVRAELFDGDGLRIAWAHGDARGQVLVIVPGAGALPADRDTAAAVLRLHGPPASDPDAGPPVEDVDLVAVGVDPPPDDDLVRGITVPATHRPAADTVQSLTLGRTRVLPELTFVPVP